ncbi:MAG TPA: hypothetical protein VF109_10725 [Mycobacteriales bacterium]
MSDYERYVAARAVTLRRTAYLLCGDWDRAEELVRRTLVGLHSAWRAAGTGDVTDAEARRLLLRCWAGEPPFAEPVPAGRRPGLGQALRGVLLGMPDRRRVVVVPRFWEALPEAGVAALLGAPVAVVRAEGEAGLAQLRALVGEVPAPGGNADAPDAARLLLSVVVEGSRRCGCGPRRSSPRSRRPDRRAAYRSGQTVGEQAHGEPRATGR